MTALVNGQAQLDSICYNDKTLASAGARSSPLRFSSLTEADAADGVEVLELAYDVTPALYVTAMVTEVGMIPPSSIPVIIREYHDNQQRIDSN